MSLKRSALLLALSGPAFGAGAQGESGGLLEDSQWSLLNRLLYDQREYRHGGRNGAARNAYKPRGGRNGYAQEWAYGLMGSLWSGFTRGTVGLGLDAHLYQGVLLDSGGGRAGKAVRAARAVARRVLLARSAEALPERVLRVRLWCGFRVGLR